MILALEVCLLAYFLYVVFYTLICSWAGRFFYKALPDSTTGIHFISILIPAYKEDSVILKTAQKALAIAYPKDQFELIIIGDQLKPETIQSLDQLPLSLIQVSFEHPTKVKALQEGLKKVNPAAELVLILDADNEMAPDFLHQISQAYAQGFQALQGRRLAKNHNSHLAVLDGLSEVLNTHIYRKGSTGLGWSSALTGSGMAFDYSLLMEVLPDMDAVGGFDRDLEVRLLKKGVKSRYLDGAIIYDEKVSAQKAFVNQRRRWIASQYEYLGKHFSTGIKALLKGNLSLFNSSILRNIQLPRVLNLGILSGLVLAFTLLHTYMNITFWVWWALWVLFIFSLFLAIPRNYYNRRLFKALTQLPKTFFTMFSLLFRLKGANKRFLHTPHGEESAKSN